MAITLRCPNKPWRISHPAEKLLTRGSLPGAYTFDLCAQSLRVARTRGTPITALLPLAMPASWMVNNRAPSPVLRHWVSTQAALWHSLVELLDEGVFAWPEVPSQTRSEIEDIATRLCHQEHGLCAISKVLALLCPHAVPLLDDAVISFALGAVPMPTSAETPTASVKLLLPMLDWFSEMVIAHEAELTALARTYTLAPLDAAQVLDRLLWFDSWGWRHHGTPVATAPRYWWLRASDTTETIAHIHAPHPVLPFHECVEISKLPAGPWHDQGLAAFS
jgi:hypothetical protein